MLEFLFGIYLHTGKSPKSMGPFIFSRFGRFAFLVSEAVGSWQWRIVDLHLIHTYNGLEPGSR